MSRPQYQKGVGLIEVLVTLLVLTTALIALATLQTRALQFNHGSYIESQANIYAYDILERMRANVLGNATLMTEYNLGQDGKSAADNAIAKRDIAQWQAGLASSLPDGKGVINCVTATRICTITILWSDVPASKADASPKKAEFIYKTML
ncbi:MAG TPA: type IV pilus modification protein PilV [Cellvibrio sp.]|nr:type IV pilus modification protein PilV [Cellvibrio sp.]